MYKILIVEDEALERDALCKIISERYAGQCSVHTAQNGKTAIELAEAMRADIAILDIEMPGINGLEAARAIREMLPRCRIIIVTAYERFQYAQLAISLGAEKYLLKPLANAELFALLDRVMEEIDRDRAESGRRDALDQLSREQFVLSAVSGCSSEESLARQLHDLNLTFTYGFFCVISAKGEGAEGVDRLTRPLWDAREDMDALVFAYDDRLLVAVMMREVFRSEADIYGIFRAHVSRVLAEEGARLYAGIGRCVTRLGQMQNSYDRAAELIALCTPAHPVQDARGDPPAHREHKDLEHKLYRYLLEKRMEEGLRCVDTMLDTLFLCLGQADAVARAACRVLSGVAERLQRDIREAGPSTGSPAQAEGVSGGIPLRHNLFAAIAFLEGEGLSKQDMALRIRAVMVQWMQALDAQPAGRIQYIRGEIERYLREHYAQDLSIRQVAKAMHYSEPYFSKLFSRCFHRNFVTYLTDIRMQAAREMLGESMVNIREVSAAVGFADANYFAKVFRKAFGVSPTEYRRFLIETPAGEKE